MVESHWNLSWSAMLFDLFGEGVPRDLTFALVDHLLLVGVIIGVASAVVDHSTLTATLSLSPQ